MALLIRDLVLPREPQRIDVRVRDGAIVEVASALAAAPNERVVEGMGRRLIPALADDHLHIGAWLRAMRSQPFPQAGLDAEECGRIDRGGPGATGWSVLFGIDHQHDVERQIAMLDWHVQHPILLIHRTGHGAFANRLGRTVLAETGCSITDVGACWRIGLGPADDAEEAALLGRMRDGLLAAGVAKIRDATPYRANMAERVAHLARAVWPVRVSFMGHPDDPLGEATHLKLFDLSAPANADLPLAVHAVEPHEIHWACKVVDVRGRIEHAAICPESLVEAVAATGCTVCANPGFLVDRCASLAPIIATGDAQFFHPVAELLQAGVKVTFGSDAPVGTPGPWSAIRGAQRRGQGEVRFPGGGLAFDEALRCAATVPALVDASALSWVSHRADFALLNIGAAAVESTTPVSATVVDGRLVFDANKGVPTHA